jgi:hypothetical protein
MQAAVESFRRSTQTPVKANALVHFRGQFQRAKVIEYSARGLLLQGTFGLVEADCIQIELISGARLTGRVAWSLGAQTSVTFPEPLPSGHPAMIALARRSN